MTKTELKKMQIKKVVEFLIDKFDAQIEDADVGRFDLTIGDFHGQMDRRDLFVDFWESIPLYGGGFDDKDFSRQREAVAFQNKINKEIQELING